MRMSNRSCAKPDSSRSDRYGASVDCQILSSLSNACSRSGAISQRPAPRRRDLETSVSRPVQIEPGGFHSGAPCLPFRRAHPMRIRSPEIRAASVEDVGAMFKVRTSVGENSMTSAELSAMGVTPEAIAHAVGNAPCAWVATVDEEVVGFAMVDLGSACLFALFVLPEHEGCGIGTRLAQTCERALFEHHPKAWLETANGSRAARLYRHLGWGNEVEVGDGDIRLEKPRP